MKVSIKQNPYNARWTVNPVCDRAKMAFREGHTVENPTIARWMGRDWFQQYMHGVFGTSEPMIVEIEEA